MSMQVPGSMHVPIAIACLAILLVVVIASAAAPVLDWSKGAFRQLEAVIADKGPPGESSPTAREATSGGRCTHCGVVVSTERMAPAGDGPAVYKVTVRLADRSTHVFSDSNAPRWRPGERIVIIEGGSSPRN